MMLYYVYFDELTINEKGVWVERTNNEPRLFDNFDNFDKENESFTYDDWKNRREL